MWDRQTVYELIDLERDRQIAKFGDQSQRTDDRWTAILTEEFLELVRAINDDEPPRRVAEELVQVAAVAVAWLEYREDPRR